MLQSKVIIDLPSREILREKTVGEWFTSVFGSRPDLRTGREMMAVSAYAVLEGIVNGFADAGLTNVISLIVDNRTIFLDTQDVPDDLFVMHRVATRSGALNRRFQEMHIAFTHEEDDLHIIIDVKLRPFVLLGEEELIITLSGRPKSLRVRRNETANRYRSRIHKFASSTRNIEKLRESLNHVTDVLAGCLHRTLPGAEIRTEEAMVQLVRHSEQQLGAMRHLDFQRHDSGRYRAAPARYHGGVIVDPFYHYYYDPFYDFAMFVMIGAAIEFAWHMPYVYFVDPYGGFLGYAHDLDYDVFASEWVGYDAIHFDDSGHFWVDDSIPEIDWVGDDHAAFDAAWGIEPTDVFDPVSNDFVSPSWDSEPIDYQNFGQEPAPSLDPVDYASADFGHQPPADFGPDASGFSDPGYQSGSPDVFNTSFSDMSSTWDSGPSSDAGGGGWDSGGADSGGGGGGWDGGGGGGSDW